MFGIITLLSKLINPVYWIIWMIKGAFGILKILPALLVVIPILLMIVLIACLSAYILPIIIVGGAGYLVYKKFIVQTT